ncbi:hypothetical protein ASF36_24605 [Methylobacterium sp. Leaf90]|nr:hypothetical protein ASF36_24605 [Methylobacterium sp. Leaf90]
MTLHCSCGHYATVKLADLPPTLTLTLTRLGQNARCDKCGKRGAQLIRDMDAHYLRVQEESGFQY